MCNGVEERLVVVKEISERLLWYRLVAGNLESKVEDQGTKMRVIYPP